MADHMHSEHVTDALRAAQHTQGSCTSISARSTPARPTPRVMLRKRGKPSMGAVTTSADSTMAEAFTLHFQREIVHDEQFWPVELACRHDVFSWVV
ncbi:Transposase-like protein [Gordonia sp. KTR9]|nr:Transposase-like protein [Gordonia sp. KTR9]